MSPDELKSFLSPVVTRCDICGATITGDQDMTLHTQYHKAQEEILQQLRKLAEANPEQTKAVPNLKRLLEEKLT